MQTVRKAMGAKPGGDGVDMAEKLECNESGRINRMIRNDVSTVLLVHFVQAGVLRSCRSRSILILDLQC